MAQKYFGAIKKSQIWPGSPLLWLIVYITLKIYSGGNLGMLNPSPLFDCLNKKSNKKWARQWGTKITTQKCVMDGLDTLTLRDKNPITLKIQK